jgi:uncharacterized protein (DUF302 family)
MTSSSSYSLEIVLPLSISEAEEKIRNALQKEQFGIIMEIDMAAKLKEKLGIDHPPHKILGACNPRLAYQALKQNFDVALALPCNIVLREEGGQTHVSVMLPSVALKPFQGLEVQKAACTAEDALHRVFSNLDSSFL